MASKVLFMLSLVALLVTNCYPTCHARLLKGFVLSSGDNVLIATASVPGLNLALPTNIFKTTEQASSLPSAGNAGAPVGEFLDVESKNMGKYMKLRALVLNALPKGTKASSGPSKRHNDFNT